MNECIESNTIGSNAVFSFCLKNKIKLIYSATSASIGNRGDDKNLSPYAFTKAKNLELLDNLKNGSTLNSKFCIFIMFMAPNKSQLEIWLQSLVFLRIFIKKKTFNRS